MFQDAGLSPDDTDARVSPRLAAKGGFLASVLRVVFENRKPLILAVLDEPFGD